MTATTIRSPRTLTERQLAVLQAVADGDSHEEIAAEYWISKTSVGTTLGHVRMKLRATNTPAAVAIAMRKGLIK